MKFAICNETFQNWPFSRALALAAECGYTGIEIAPFTIAENAREITPARRTELRRQAEQAGLAVVGLHWLLARTEGYYLTSPTRETRLRTGLYLGELARLCRDLGGTVLVLGSPQQRNLLAGVSPEQACDYAADSIAAALPALDDCQVTLALEPLGPEEGNFLLTAQAAVELIERIDSPRVRLQLDVKAMSSEGTPVTDIIRGHAAHLAHFHANDPNRRGPGMGDVDFVPILQALRDVAYQGWISVEVFDYAPGIERLARDSIGYLRGCLAHLEAA